MGALGSDNGSPGMWQCRPHPQAVGCQPQWMLTSGRDLASLLPGPG